MAVDTDYIDDLMKSIEPVVYPDGVPGDEDDNDDEFRGEEQYEYADPVVEEAPKEKETFEDLFGTEEEVVDNSAADFVVPEGLNAAELEETLAEHHEWDQIGEEPQEIELDMDLSMEEIDAMLNAAKETAREEVKSDNPEEVTDILSLFGDDEDISDIKETLDKADRNEAVDEGALKEREVVLPDIDGEENEEASEGKGKKKKKAKKNKADKEPKEGKEGKKEKGKGFFAKIIEALTEEVDEEGVAIPEQEATGVTDENAQILSELDSEEDPKRKKKKKKKKGKGGESEGQGDDGSIREKSDDEEAAGGKKEKKKKPKKEKKVKPVDDTPEKPQKKLPKKRVRNTFILALSVVAAVAVLSYFFADYQSKKQARYAFDNQEYEEAYSDLVGMKLNEDDMETYKKAQTIMLLQRKVDSYDNYMRLGMEAEALNALLEGVALYPAMAAGAEVYGVTEQVNQAYAKILDGLSKFGISVADAEEINSYTSSVQYNKRILAIINETESGNESVQETEFQVVDESDIEFEDILPEEKDFLPDNEKEVFE